MGQMIPNVKLAQVIGGLEVALGFTAISHKHTGNLNMFFRANATDALTKEELKGRFSVRVGKDTIQDSKLNTDVRRHEVYRQLKKHGDWELVGTILACDPEESKAGISLNDTINKALLGTPTIDFASTPPTTNIDFATLLEPKDVIGKLGQGMDTALANDLPELWDGGLYRVKEQIEYDGGMLEVGMKVVKLPNNTVNEMDGTISLELENDSVVYVDASAAAKLALEILEGGA